MAKKWKAIDTVPYPDTRGLGVGVLVYSLRHGPIVVCPERLGNGCLRLNAAGREITDATHWHPLPALPIAESD